MMKEIFLLENRKIKGVNLTQKVTIRGHDFWGHKAELTFRPVQSYGWWRDLGVNIDGQKVCKAIAPDMVQSRKRRLCLTDVDGVWLNHPEHITVLRLFGLDRVAIGGSRWPPYFLTSEIWERLKPFLFHADYCLDWYSARKSVEHYCSRNRYVRVSPSVKRICVDAYIDYKDVGEWRGRVETGDCRLLKHVLCSETQGWPKWLHKLSVTASNCGWPHHKRICWPQERGHGARECFGLHRMLDIFGAICSVSLVGKRIVSCRILSHKGGHESDIFALKRFVLDAH